CSRRRRSAPTCTWRLMRSAGRGRRGGGHRRRGGGAVPSYERMSRLPPVSRVLTTDPVTAQPALSEHGRVDRSRTGRMPGWPLGAQGVPPVRAVERAAAGDDEEVEAARRVREGEVRPGQPAGAEGRV